VRQLFSFPDPVNEVAARLVAGGVVILCAVILIVQWPWLTAVLAYGFVARVLTGPKLSPLGLFVTRVAVPALPFAERPTPGLPKRFAQGMGAAMSLTAVVLHFGFGATGAAYVFVGMILGAAALEAGLGFCIGCRIFSLLMRIGIIPVSACPECADITKRRRPSAA
jgi:hypothetical protein